MALPRTLISFSSGSLWLFILYFSLRRAQPAGGVRPARYESVWIYLIGARSKPVLSLLHDGGGAEAPAINMATFYKLNGLMITLQASWAYFYMPKEV